MSEKSELWYLRVDDVDPSISEYELFKLFDTYGRVDTLFTLFTPTDPTLLFAFVSYKCEKDADNAKYEIHETKVGAQYVKVKSSAGPDKDPLVNTDWDFRQKDRVERFPLGGEVRPLMRNDINRYTRSDYHQEDSKGKWDGQCRTVASDKPAAEEEAADGKTENAATECVEEPEAKEMMTLEEYQKVLEGERKALEALKTEERKTEVDKELASIEIAEKEERAKQLQVP